MPYSPEFREEKFSETELPISGVLGNSRSIEGKKGRRSLFMGYYSLLL